MVIPGRTTPQRPLRIAFVTPEPIPGGGVPGMAVTLARGLAALGHQVDCWMVLETRVAQGWSEVEGLTLRTVSGAFHWGRWYSGARTPRIVTNLAVLGTRAVATPRLVRRLLAAHREAPYDVLYRFSTIELLGIGRHLADLPPLVLHPEVHAAGELRWTRAERHLARRCHSLPQRAVVGTLLRARALLQRRDIQRATAVIAPSRRFAQLVGTDYGVPADRFTVIPNPVDLDRFHPSSPPPSGQPKVRITYVGRAAVRKGIDLLVELSHHLDDLANDVELEVIASYSFWSDYRPLLADANPCLATVRPVASNRSVAEALASTDLLLQPSRYEPFAITVAEALASGTPVVATDEVGAAEGLDPRCATVVPADAAALEAALRARVAAIQAGEGAVARECARAEAERRFAPELVCRAVADCLERAAARTEPAAR